MTEVRRKIEELYVFVKDKNNIRKEVKLRATVIKSGIAVADQELQEWRRRAEAAEKALLEAKENAMLGKRQETKRTPKKHKDDEYGDKEQEDGEDSDRREVENQKEKRKKLKEEEQRKKEQKKNEEKENKNEEEDKKKKKKKTEERKKELKKKENPRHRRERSKSDALVIEAKDKTTYAALLRKVREDPELKQLGEKVVRTRRTQKGKMLLGLKKDPSVRSSAFKKLVEKSLGEDANVRALSQESVVEYKDLDEITTEDEVRCALKVQCNLGDVPMTIRLRKAYGGTQTASIRLATDAANELLKTGRVKVGWYSTIRQTRSRVRAAIDAETPNLAAERDSLEEESLSRSSFEPSIIDVEGGDKIECGGCDKPNNAELYMVQCRDCSRWYYLSCANVRQSTVQKEVFMCSLCIPRIPIKQPSSVTSHTTTSSVRQARIGRELERLNEERKLMERIHQEEQAQQEKARKEKYDREKQYLAKKFDLLKQQDEQEGSRTSNSHRSQQSRQDKESIVQNWINDVITITEKTGFVDQSSEILTKDAEQELMANPIVAADVHATSTPIPNRNINSAAGMVQPAPVRLRLRMEPIPRNTESMAIGETAEEDSDGVIGAVGGSQGNINSQIVPFVDVGPFNVLLHDPVMTKSKTGTLPKVVRKQSTYEQWRSRTQELEQKHKEENNIRRKRELELVNQLNRLTIQRTEDLQKQRDVEQELQRH
ncbi:uncharacterized protein LOC135705240 [Ochlerotatus camptorhynchus]|uniref:uncharacterized protein LOC135705240 n=1 Tax=Ochlerotatus camptorhynchus TaxID=644619 RepID=UPI0031E1A774